MSIVNFAITKPLEQKINQIIRQVGFMSKAEFFRFAILNYIDSLCKPVYPNTDISQEELEKSAEALKQTIVKKFHNKKLPSIEEQLADI